MRTDLSYPQDMTPEKLSNIRQKLAERLPDNEKSPIDAFIEMGDTSAEARDREGTLDARKGERGPSDAAHNTPAVWEKFLEGNPEYLRQHFNKYVESRTHAKALVGTQFESRKYESRNPLLRKYASHYNAPDGSTVHEQLQRAFRK